MDIKLKVHCCRGGGEETGPNNCSSKGHEEDADNNHYNKGL